MVHIPTLRPKYIPYTYIDPLGLFAGVCLFIGTSVGGVAQRSFCQALSAGGGKEFVVPRWQQARPHLAMAKAAAGKAMAASARLPLAVRSSECGSSRGITIADLRAYQLPRAHK